MRRRWIYPVGREPFEVDEDYAPEPKADYHVMPDVKPHKNMLTGEIVNSRSRHREILRDHDMIEIGNEMKHLNKGRTGELPSGVKDDLVRLVNEKWKH